MPTGHTAKILEGATFEQFVWDCARSFCAFANQRDDVPGSPPVLEEKPSEYESERLDEARLELAAFQTANEEERRRLWAEENVKMAKPLP